MSFGKLPAVIVARIFEYQAPSVSCARVLLRDTDVWHQLIVPWLRSLAPWLAPLSLDVTARVPTTALETTHALALQATAAMGADAGVANEIKTAYRALKGFAADESADVRLEKLLEEARRSCQGMQKAAKRASADVAALANRVNDLRMQNALVETLHTVPNASTCRLFLSVYGKRRLSCAGLPNNKPDDRPIKRVLPHFLKAVANGLHHPLVLELLYREVMPETLLCVGAISPQPSTFSAVLDLLRTRIPVSHAAIELRPLTLLRLLGCGVDIYVAALNVLFELRQWTFNCSWAPIPQWRMCEKKQYLVRSSTREAKRAQQSADDVARATAIRTEHARRGFAPNRVQDATLDDDDLHAFLRALEAHRHRQTVTHPMESVGANAPTHASSSSSSSSGARSGGNTDVLSDDKRDGGTGGKSDERKIDSIHTHVLPYGGGVSHRMTRQYYDRETDLLADILGSPGNPKGYFSRYHLKHDVHLKRAVSPTPPVAQWSASPSASSSVSSTSSSVAIASSTVGSLCRTTTDPPTTTSGGSESARSVTPTKVVDDDKDARIIDYLLYYHTSRIDTDMLLIMWRLEPRAVGLALQNPEIVRRLETYDGQGVRGGTLIQNKKHQNVELRTSADADGAFFRHEGAVLPPGTQLAYLRHQFLVRLPIKDGAKYVAATAHLSLRRVSSLVDAIDPKLETFPSFLYRKGEGAKRTRKRGAAGMCLRTLAHLLDYATSHGLLSNMAPQMHAARKNEEFELVCCWTQDAPLMASLAARYPAFVGELCGAPGTVDIRAALKPRPQNDVDGDTVETDEDEEENEEEEVEFEEEPSDME